MNIKKTTIFLAAGFLFFKSYSQESFTLTLPQAREYALQHNKTLLNARGQLASSKEKYKETVARGLPQIDGSLDYMTYFNYEMNFSFGSPGGEMPDITQLPFDDGDRAVMGIIGNMFSSEPIIMDDQLSGKVQLSQLLFSGQYMAGVQTAKIARKLADQSLILTELDIKENITNTYCGILISEKTLSIVNDNIKNLETILQHTNNLYKAGIAEQTDVDQLKITVSQLKNTQKSFERMNQLNYNMLKFQLGVAPETKIVLLDKIEQLLDYVNPETAMLTEFDITNNMNYQLMESQSLISKKQVDLQNWAYAPTVAAYYSYTQKIVTTAFDLTPNHLAGVNLSVPILSGGARNARVSQAKINMDIAQRNQEMVKDQLELQKNQLLFNYQNAMENYNTQKENVDVALRVYQNIQNKYQQGMVSSLDLTQANSNYLNAQNNYTSSVLTLIQAQTSLDKLYNRL